jgi:DNA (cytosine-5)-methyltransferase 1
MKIPIIDLFAGPGGLSEGFFSVTENSQCFFDLKLSIEKDPVAHKTLLFRSFYRQFIRHGKPVPKEYYEVLQEPDLNKREIKRETLFKKFKEGDEAKNEAICLELGLKTRKKTDILIKEALGKSHKKNWVLIGGPPCQAYSLAGRSRMGGMNEEDHRVFLYKEYLRIISSHQPAVFVMENVKGLLSATLNGDNIFKKIIKDLEKPSSVSKKSGCPNYKIYSLVKKNVESEKDFLIRAENYGIPQKRHRIILVGVREDINIRPDLLIPSMTPTSLESVIGQLPQLRSVMNRTYKSSIVINGKKKRIYTNVDDSDKDWIDLINSFKEQVFGWNGFTDTDLSGIVKVSKYGKGAEYISCQETLNPSHPLFSWYHDTNINGVINHESRSHLLQDIKRYLFCSIYTKKYKKFPRLEDFEKHSKDLIPDHENVKTGKFNDRFRVQLKNFPATTVTSHISKDGHYFIHYDPKQCRSLTVREAARIQTFPDNYLFCGSRTQQFHQVGNAVPPYLAKQIGEIVKDIFHKMSKYKLD